MSELAPMERTSQSRYFALFVEQELEPAETLLCCWSALNTIAHQTKLVASMLHSS